MLPFPSESAPAMSSRSSSVYSDDEALGTNSIKVPVHHRAESLSILSGTPHEHIRFPSQSCATVSPSHATGGHDSTTADPVDHRFRFETKEEAEERRRLSATLSRVPTAELTKHIQNLSLGLESKQETPTHDYNKEPLQDSSKLSFLLEEYKPTTPGSVKSDPRPPTPPRRRPRITSASGLSLGSIPDVSNSMSTVPTFTVASNQQAMLQSSIELRAMSNRTKHFTNDKDSPYSASLAKQKNRKITLDALLGHKTSNHTPPKLVTDQEDINRLSNNTNTSRRQGKANWNELVAVGPTQSETPGMVSATGKIYGRGDHIAGYISGKFVTNLQETSSRQTKQRTSFTKRMWCI
jgi:hypothetical protein